MGTMDQAFTRITETIFESKNGPKAPMLKALNSMEPNFQAGKVHGSMARNGKVRNQAPKVEKMERQKKLIVGRAKKRAQYKNRIINVDPNDKRKKGPNAGSGKKEA